MAVERSQHRLDSKTSPQDAPAAFDMTTIGDRITELSSKDIISVLGILNHQLARPGDPTDLRFNRAATLNLATAAIDGKDFYIPQTALKIYTAVQSGVLNSEVPYLVTDISKKIGVGAEPARRGMRMMSRLGMVDSNREGVSGSTPRSHVFPERAENSAETPQLEAPTEITPAAALLQRLHDDIRATEPTDTVDAFRREAAGYLIKNAIADGIFDPKDARSDFVSSLLQDNDGNIAGSVFRAMEYERLSSSEVYSTAKLRAILAGEIGVSGQMREAMELLRTVGIAESKSLEVGDTRQGYVLHYRNVVSRANEVSAARKSEMTPEQLVDRIRVKFGVSEAGEIAKIAHLPPRKVTEILHSLNRPVPAPKRSKVAETTLQEGAAVTLPRDIVARDGVLYERTFREGIPMLVPIDRLKQQN